ncbi:hypothetical protein [Rufibacter soli]
MSKLEQTQVERNLRGIELEKASKVAAAATLYEENLREGFDGSHPYTRLAVIYKKQGRLEDEIRVLESAVAVFGKTKKGVRQEADPKLQKFKDRLEKITKGKS